MRNTVRIGRKEEKSRRVGNDIGKYKEEGKRRWRKVVKEKRESSHSTVGEVEVPAVGMC